MKTVTRRITRDELGSFNLAARSLLPILAAMAKFTLESLWITGGALRSQLVNPGKSYSRDIDIIFFNRQEKSEAYERDIETLLTSDTRITCLSVKNQARVNGYVDTVRYGSVFESVDNFPDNSVAIGLQLKRGHLSFLRSVRNISGCGKNNSANPGVSAASFFS